VYDYLRLRYEEETFSSEYLDGLAASQGSSLKSSIFELAGRRSWENQQQQQDG